MLPSTRRQSGLPEHRGVAWLVDTNLATSGKSDLRHGSPPRFVDVGALDSSRRQPLDLTLEIAAHEVQVTSVRLCWVDRKFGRRQAEDQPPSTGVGGIEIEHLGEERTIGVSVSAVEDHVRAEDHSHILT